MNDILSIGYAAAGYGLGNIAGYHAAKIKQALQNKKTGSREEEFKDSMKRFKQTDDAMEAGQNVGAAGGAFLGAGLGLASNLYRRSKSNKNKK